MNVITSSPFDKKIKEIASKPRLGKPNFQVFPGVINDEAFCELSTRIVIKLSQIFPDEDWSPCLTVPGYWPSPRGGIATAHYWDLPKSYVKALKMMGELAYRNRKVGSTSIKKTSNTSVPAFTTNLEYKKAIIDFWMDYGDDILETADKRGFEALLQLPYAITYAGTVGYRRQADSFKSLDVSGGRIRGYEWKARTVFDWTGTERTSDKTLHTSFSRKYPYMQAQRSRQVAQLSQTVNLPNVFYYGQIQRGMFEFGNAVWKSHDGPTNARELDYPEFSHTLKLDVKELDRNLHFDVLESLRQGYLAGGCHPRWIEHLRRCVHCPMLCYEDAQPYKGWSWTYDPRKVMTDYKLHDYGMPSGFGGVAPEDKMAFTALIFSIFDDMNMFSRPAIEEDMLTFLGNRTTFVRTKNNGDDTILNFKDSYIRGEFLARATKLGITIQEEERRFYLGQDIVNLGNVLSSIPQLVNGIKNILVPEHEWGGRRRIAPGFGLIERNKYYTANPGWETAWSTLNGTMREMGLLGLDDYISDGSNKENQPPMVMDMQNLNDILFTLNPDAINYKLAADDVSKGLLDLYYLTYNEEESSRMNYLWEGK